MTREDPKSVADWLVAVGARRDRDAFRRLYEHFAPRLRSYMRAQGASPTTAEDLVQETMVKVWNKAGLYNPSKAAPSAWLFRVARNLRIDKLRRQRMFEVEIEEGTELAAGLTSAGNEGANAVAAAQLGRLIAELPPEQSEVVRLAFFEGMTHSEICTRLDVPLGTVKSRLRLAFGKLRDALGEES